MRRGLTATVLAMAAVLVPAAAAKAPRAYVPSACDNAAYKPRAIIVACGDGNLRVTGLRHWHGWNGPHPHARGTALANDCKPACFDGKVRRYPATVHLSGLRTCPSGANQGKRQYTRIRVRFTGRHHPAGPRTQRTRFPCPS